MKFLFFFLFYVGDRDQFVNSPFWLLALLNFKFFLLCVGFWFLLKWKILNVVFFYSESEKVRERASERAREREREREWEIDRIELWLSACFFGGPKWKAQHVYFGVFDANTQISLGLNNTHLCVCIRTHSLVQFHPPPIHMQLLWCRRFCVNKYHYVRNFRIVIIVIAWRQCCSAKD